MTANVMTSDVQRMRILVDWLDPLSAVVKLCAAAQACAAGEFKLPLDLRSIVLILDAGISVILLGGLIYQRVRKHLNEPPESQVLREFAKLRSKSLCPFARKAKLFGGGIAEGQDIKTTVRLLVPQLLKLTTIGRTKKLDGFVIGLPADRFANNLLEFSRSLNSVLRELAAFDPSGENCMNGDILKEGWQFTFNHTRFFITTFAPLYNSRHPRHSNVRNTAFIFLQMEYSFDHHGISSRNSRREGVKRRIRKAFQDAGSGYDVALVKQPMEALKYIKPIKPSDPPVYWWKAK
jgi:hypothetical protein